VKIASSVLVIAVVAVVVGVTALVKMDMIAGNGDYIYSQNLLPIAQLGEAQHALSEAKVDLAQYTY
jgi:methyl-accepting chemotaxis protein